MSLKTPAKINLYLRVLARRQDGYHQIDSLMAPVELFDTLTVELKPGVVQVSCPGHPELEGQANLAYQAATMLLRASNRPQGANISIKKEIPIQAGLGGGSSNAAATMQCLNQLLDPPLPTSTLFSLATQLGADVPFFLQDKPCQARGIGHELEQVHDLPRFWVILACAPFGLSTRQVYESLNYPLTFPIDDDTQPYLISLVDFQEFAAGLYNDLQPVAEQLRPSIRNVREELFRSGARAAFMTGSGPTVVGLFRSKNHASGTLATMKKEPGWRYILARGIT